jgi:hypothetical protein
VKASIYHVRLDKKSLDVSIGRKQRQAEREAEITHEKRRRMARDDNSLKQAMAFTKGWPNVSGMPIVPCEPLAGIEVFNNLTLSMGYCSALSSLASLKAFDWAECEQGCQLFLVWPGTMPGCLQNSFR